MGALLGLGEGGLVGLQQLGDLVLQGLPELVGGGELAALGLVAQLVHEADGQRGGDIGLDERGFQVVEQIVIDDGAAGENGGDAFEEAF